MDDTAGALAYQVDDESGLTPMRIRVAVYCADEITYAGICSKLTAPVVAVPAASPGTAAAVVVVVDVLDEQALSLIDRTVQRHGPRLVLVVSVLDERALMQALGMGVRVVLTRAEVTAGSLLQAVRTAAGGQLTVPDRLLRDLLDRVGRVDRDVMAPRGLSLLGPSGRERDVLRLLAEGLSTVEVAAKLCYSERTIKTILQTLCERVHARNRTHAVALAMRHHWI